MLKENKSFYSTQQVECACHARNLLHTPGCLVIWDLKAILWMNLFTNCPVTTKDVDLAKKIFGADIVSLKGKTTTEHKWSPVVQDCVKIPYELIQTQ